MPTLKPTLTFGYLQSRSVSNLESEARRILPTPTESLSLASCAIRLRPRYGLTLLYSSQLTSSHTHCRYTRVSYLWCKTHRLPAVDIWHEHSPLMPVSMHLVRPRHRYVRSCVRLLKCVGSASGSRGLMRCLNPRYAAE